MGILVKYWKESWAFMKSGTLNMRQSLIIIACIAALVAIVWSCLDERFLNANHLHNEILTQKKVDKNKIPITVLVKYAFTINRFEELVEEKFPDIDIIQVGNYTSERGTVEYERRLKHDDLTDIVMTWPLDVGREYWPERLLDLSGMRFTENYHTYMLNAISGDEGKLYYLPGPAQVRGIVYNKTLFEEKNWPIPTNYQEFVALCQQIEASGIRSLQLGFANAEVLDTAFVGFSYGNGFSKVRDSQWMVQYNQGKGSVSPQLDPALDTFQDLIAAGVFKKSDLDVSYAGRETMLFTRKCAMVEDSILLAQMGKQFNGCTDEFALMPFFNPEPNGSWVRLYMVCYIGVNKHLAEPANRRKYDAVMKLMEYISSPDGQQALTADTGAMYCSVNNVPPPDGKEIALLLPDLSKERVAIFPELKNAQGTLREALADLLRGNISKSELIEFVDNRNNMPISRGREKILGTATSNFSTTDTGNWVADTMRKYTGADFALFLDNGKDGLFNGKGISAKIYAGPQTIDDVIRILPDLKSGDTGLLQKISIKGTDLINTLEYSIAVNNNISGWFYYFSGLKMEFDPTAEPGKRIRRITTSDGAPIIADKLYTVGVMAMTIPPEYIKTTDVYNLTIKDLLVRELQIANTIAPTRDKRFVIVR